MAKKTEIEIKCEKCGKPQSKNENMSNGNFDVFDCNANVNVAESSLHT